MKDLAQNVAEDVLSAAKDGSDLAQEVAEDVLGATKNGRVKVFIVEALPCPSSSSSGGGRVHAGPPRRPPGACMRGHRCAKTTAHWTPLPHHHHSRRRRRQHVKVAAQNVVDKLWRTLRRAWRRTWPSGPGRGAPSSTRHHRRRCRLCAELELELIQSHMAQKPVLRGEVGCACVARKASVERGGMGERGCARRLDGWVWVCSSR